MELYQKLQEKFHSLEEDIEKFEQKNNKAAGTRLRKGLQEIKLLAQDMRKEIQEKKKII